jgi:RNA polymerase sigma factor (sigma-70 family)
MVKSIKNLKDTGRFKSWLYRIASIRIKRHYRISGNKKITNKTVFDIEKLTRQPGQKPDALNQLLQQELSQAIHNAMANLKNKYRNILVLRCYENMSYTDIAYTMDCSSIKAQLLFFRAKQSLKKQLQKNGYKKEHLMASLGIFGAITALPFGGTSSSAATIGLSAMKVGIPASIIGIVTTKIGISIGIMAAMCLFIVSGVVVNKNVEATKSHIIAQEKYSATSFKYPSEVVASYNPQSKEWKGTPHSNHFPESVSLDKWLLGPPPTNRSSVLIPKDGWILLRFSSPIIDGSGDDIIIIEKCKCGEEAEVFLADDNNNEKYIGTISVAPTNVHTLTTFAYDISKLDLTFTPTSIKILVTNPGGIEHGGAIPGFDLVSIQANLSD